MATFVIVFALFFIFTKKALLHSFILAVIVFADDLQILCSLFDIVPYLYLQEMLYRICIGKSIVLVFARVLY